jgi:WD40 repeat protein
MLRNLDCFTPLAAMLTLCFANAVAKADDFLAPNWTAGGAFTNRGTTVPAPPTFSNDGSKILYLQNLTVARTGHTQGAISVYNTNWQCIDRISLISTTIGSACFAFNSSAFFYSSVTPNQQSTTIWRHELSTRTEKSLNVREFNPITLMATSPDGTYLAYYVPNTGKVSIYNFITNKVTAQISQTTSSLAFLGKTGKIVLSGPTIYDSSGTKKSEVSNAANPVAVSPDGKTLVTVKSATSKLTAYNATCCRKTGPGPLLPRIRRWSQSFLGTTAM